VRRRPWTYHPDSSGETSRERRGLVYRYQTHVQVKLAQWREFHSRLKELNALMEAKGLLPFQLWESKFDSFDAALLVADYATLAEFERENDSMHADPACMAAWREILAFVDEPPWTEMWWRPSSP
jgi:hypothetical protein